MPSAIILIQPAFALREVHLPTPEDLAVGGVPATIAEFLVDGAELQAEFLACLRRFVAFGVRVFLRYWPDDQFFAYPAALMQALHESGIDIASVVIAPTPGLDAFSQHAQVSQDPAMLNELRAILRRINA